MKKKLIVLMVAILVILPITVYAYSGIDTNISIGSSDAAKASVGITNRLLGVVQTIGTILSVGALIIIGIRYIISSVEEKAQLKGVLGYYVIGAILVLTTTNVVAFAYDIINDFDHKYDTPVIISQATCTQTGKMRRRCIECGYTITVSIPKKEHNYRDNIIKIATCAEEGKKEQTCRNCGYKRTDVVIPREEHNYRENILRYPSCRLEGKKEQICMDCGYRSAETIIPKYPHFMDSWRVTNSATCCVTGRKKRECVNCGEEEFEVIPIDPDGHDLEIWSDTNGDCTTQGIRTYHCRWCDKFIEETYRW